MSVRLDSPEILKKLKKIKMFIVDVDGVLTDGTLFWNGGHGFTRVYNVKDGYGLILLMRYGIEVGIITAAKSDDVKNRAEYLGIKHLYMGDEKKLSHYETILRKTKFKDEEMAYIGDELFDIPVLERVGLSIAVFDAAEEVRKRVDYVTTRPGGAGAVREITDAIRKVQGLGPYLD